MKTCLLYGSAIAWLTACGSPQELGTAAGGASSTSLGSSDGGHSSSAGGATSSGGTTNAHTSAQSGGTTASATVGTGGGGNGGTSAGATPTACVGTLDDVNLLSGQPCPVTYCDALIQASCDVLKSPLTHSELESCGSFGAAKVSFSISPTQQQVCYYVGNILRGITLSSDSPAFCDNSSSNVTGGAVLSNCSSPTVLCDKLANSGTGGTGQGGATGTGATTPIPPAKCFNRVSSTCMPCCDPTPLDCANLPDGYPGYSCSEPPIAAGGATSTVPIGMWPGNDYCSCRCRGGQWACDC